MQDEINEKTVALYIKTGKLTAAMLQKGYESHVEKGQGADYQSPAWEADPKAAYEAERGRFQH